LEEQFVGLLVIDFSVAVQQPNQQRQRLSCTVYFNSLCRQGVVDPLFKLVLVPGKLPFECLVSKDVLAVGMANSLRKRLTRPLATCGG